MKSSLILIICLLFIVKIQDTTAENYSIQTFINYIQDMGYWEIFTQVSLLFGIDVSIDFCKTIVQSPHCDETIRVYISIPNNSKIDGKDESITQEYLDINDFADFLDRNNYSDILLQKIPTSEFKDLINNFIKKYN